MITLTKKLIEVALPLEKINAASAREKSIRHGHPSTLHLWWARRPLAAARAVIFAQIVDDPSAHPELFPTEEAQEAERQRLFRLIEQLVQWENTTNEDLLNQARDEIWKSWRRTCAAERQELERSKEEIGSDEYAKRLALFDPDKLPAFHDPFAGGGALPLEAQRLGLEAYASDLNPVAVLINKAMIEIPPKFAGQPPVNPESRKKQIGNRITSDALQGTRGVAEGDGGSAGGLSPGAVPATRGNIRDAITDYTGGSFSTSEHRRGLGAGVGQGEGAVSRNSTGVASGSGDPADAVRADRLVSRTGNDAPTRADERSGTNVDHHAPQSAVGNGNEEGENSEKEIENGEQALSSTENSEKLQQAAISSFLSPTSYKGAQGLAEDVRYYGKWMRDEAEKRIGHLYPKIEITAAVAEGRKDLQPLIGQKLTVIAWLWARTVKSPNPAFRHVDVPLASTFMLSTKPGKEAYVEPIIEDRSEEIENRSEEIENRNEEIRSSEQTLFSTSSFLSPHSSYRFTVRVGKPKDAEAAKNGTKLSRGANFRCLMSDMPITGDYIKAEGKAGRMGARLMAVVAEGERGRVYLPPMLEHEAIAQQAQPEWEPEGDVPARLTGGTCVPYGLDTWGKLFTPRQLVALNTFSDLVQEAREQVRRDALAVCTAEDAEGRGGLGQAPLRSSAPSAVDSFTAEDAEERRGSSEQAPLRPSTPSAVDHDLPLDAGGCGAAAYADAVAVYLAFAVDRGAESWCSLSRWQSTGDFVAGAYARQALPMIWDYAEVNPFSSSTRNFRDAIEWVAEVVDELPGTSTGTATQHNAQETFSINKTLCKLISTDPPYYDNIGYADLSDFFYVWMRRTLRSIFPTIFATLAVPKAEELVATPYRHGGKAQAEKFFLEGMTHVMQHLAKETHPAFPVTIYYAFKQSETDGADGIASTGWETFLDAVIRAGFAVTGTWPMRTEREARSINLASNALASSIVLVCRCRDQNAPTVTRRDFLQALKDELPVALRLLQGLPAREKRKQEIENSERQLFPVSSFLSSRSTGIAPVDLAQAAIGPGMAVFTRYGKVIDASGKPLSVREALALINATLDEVLAEQEGDFDADTRWALAWFEQFGFAEGEYGVAETLSKAKNTSVSGMVSAGLLASKSGKVRLLRPDELPEDWDPNLDVRLTVWEMVHHLVRALSQGELAAAQLVAKLGPHADVARELAYRLYAVCERKKRAAEALAYNGLVQSWPEMLRLAGEQRGGAPVQQDSFFTAEDAEQRRGYNDDEDQRR